MIDQIAIVSYTIRGTRIHERSNGSTVNISLVEGLLTVLLYLRGGKTMYYVVENDRNFIFFKSDKEAFHISVEQKFRQQRI